MFPQRVTSLLLPAVAGAAMTFQLHAQQPPARAGAPGSIPPGIDIEALPVRGNVYMLVGAGGNSTVQIGPQGVLVVDTMRESAAGDLVAAINALSGGKPIRYVLNTHAHPDHTGGNLKVAEAGSQLVAGNFAGELGQAGAESAFIVAHENVLNALSTPVTTQPPVPFGAWPTDTFFQMQKDMYFNGEAVQLLHVQNAHTDGDSLVFFRSSDVISAGDLYVTTRYPHIDLDRGGHVNGVIEGLNRIIDLAVSEQFTEGGTQIVPGHGRISDEMDVVEYRDMVTIVRDRVQDLIGRRKTLDEVKAARPTFEFDPRYGTDDSWTPAMFVEAVYSNLTAAPAAADRAR